MRFKRIMPALLATLALAIMTTVVAAQPAIATPCYGASCTGLDPYGRCSGDAKTVNSLEVKDGILELRYSRSCNANWGRYTPWARNAATYVLHGAGVHARVTAWNPDEPSVRTAHMADVNPFASSWSEMVDGSKTACTGVELTHINGNDWENYGWTEGPCY